MKAFMVSGLIPIMLVLGGAVDHVYTNRERERERERRERQERDERE